MRYAFSDAIDGPQIHLPVFWIPAFPAGMTVLAGSFQSQRPVIPAGIAGQIGRIADLLRLAARRVGDTDVPHASSCHGGQCTGCVMPFQIPSTALSFTSLCSGYRHSLPV